MNLQKRDYYRLQDHAQLFAAGLPILLYHIIGKTPVYAKGRYLYVPTHVLARQLRELADSSFRTVRLNEIAPRGGSLDHCVAITFDDGYLSTFENALPLLLEHRCQSTLFLVADLLGKYNEWDQAFGEIPSPLMSVDQIKEWLESGQQIGSHSLTHPRLTAMSPQRQREEIEGSKKELEDTFGVPIYHFAYPYGDWDERVVDFVGNAGYLTASSTQFGVNTTWTPPYALRRIMVRTPVGTFRRTGDRLCRLFAARWLTL